MILPLLRSLLAAAITTALCAQTAPPAFEAASIKPHEGPIHRLGVYTSGSQLSAEGANLASLISFAYSLSNYQLAGSAPVFDDRDLRWDVVAKAPVGPMPSRNEFRGMVKTLLTQRFHLVFHAGSREIPVYDLVVAPGGPKLKPSDPAADPTSHFGPRNGGRNIWFTMPKATMSDLAAQIDDGAGLDRPVVDKTGLTGVYSIEIDFTPEYRLNRAGDPHPDDVSLFTALQSQLGLRLMQSKSLIQTLVVDSAEKPSGN